MFNFVGPSTQTNVRNSATAIDTVVTFEAGLSAPNFIAIRLNITDDDVSLEPVEHFQATLTVDMSSGVLVIQLDTTTINVVDNDGISLYACIVYYISFISAKFTCNKSFKGCIK